jgi:hypothetical protein
MGGFGQLGNQEEPQYLNRKGLRSREHNSIAMKSRMMGDHQVRFRERLVVKFHRPTRRVPRMCVEVTRNAVFEMVVDPPESAYRG